MHRNTKKKQKSVYIYFLDNFFKKTHCLNGHEFEQIPRDRTGKPGVLQSMGSQSQK